MDVIFELFDELFLIVVVVGFMDDLFGCYFVVVCDVEEVVGVGVDLELVVFFVDVFVECDYVVVFGCFCWLVVEFGDVFV